MSNPQGNDNSFKPSGNIGTIFKFGPLVTGNSSLNSSNASPSLSMPANFLSLPLAEQQAYLTVWQNMGLITIPNNLANGVAGVAAGGHVGAVAGPPAAPVGAAGPPPAPAAHVAPIAPVVPVAAPNDDGAGAGAGDGDGDGDEHKDIIDLVSDEEVVQQDDIGQEANDLDSNQVNHMGALDAQEADAADAMNGRNAHASAYSGPPALEQFRQDNALDGSDGPPSNVLNSQHEASLLNSNLNNVLNEDVNNYHNGMDLHQDENNGYENDEEAGEINSMEVDGLNESQVISDEYMPQPFQSAFDEDDLDDEMDDMNETYNNNNNNNNDYLHDSGFGNIDDDDDF